MSTKELLLEEINRAPEEVLQRLLRYLHSDLKRPIAGNASKQRLATGPYADYWNQFIGAFAGEEWDRPPQDTLEQREVW